MRNRALPVVFAGLLAALAASCGKSGDDAPAASTITLSPAEVASLLGLTGKEGLEIGEVTSGKDGVTVKSIALKQGDSTEVEVRDVALGIGSPARLTYAVSSLTIGSLEVLDWRTQQRARATGVRVDRPGEGFLTKLDAAISTARSGGPLRTADLSCDRLGIDRIDYELHGGGPGAKATRVRIDGVAIERATTDTLGSLTVAGIGVNDAVAGRGLNVTGVNRTWADQLLALLAAGASPAATSQPSAKPSPWPGLATRLLPFDHIELAEVSIDLAKVLGADPSTARVTGVRLDVQRGTDGRFAGVAGQAAVSVDTVAFGAEGREFFHKMGNAALERSVAGTLDLKAVRDAASAGDEITLSLAAPGLASASLTATTRGLPELLGQFLAQQEIDPDIVKVASVVLQGRDDGLVAFLLGGRCADCRTEALKFLHELPFEQPDPTQDERLRGEVSRFILAPDTVSYSARNEGGFMPAKEFVTAMFGGPDHPASFTDRLAFTGKAPAAATTADPPTLAADYAAYEAACALKHDGDFRKANAFDRFGAWLAAANVGDAAAELLVGDCRCNGDGTRQDRDDALQWYRKASDGGNVVAMRRLGSLYHSGFQHGGSHPASDKQAPPDDGQAVVWLGKAAAAGDSEAMRLLGGVYDGYTWDHDRHGVPLDYQQAFTWYRRSAAAGNTDAMVNVGEMYASDKLGTRDPAGAFKWYVAAANAGNTNAMERIVSCYCTGEGVTKDFALARQWAQRAADAGDNSAMRTLKIFTHEN
jgi:TPR repeat protein